MSIFSRLFRQKTTPREERLCDWMLSNLDKGLSPEEITEHLKVCHICGPTVAARRKAKGAEGLLNVDTGKVPTALIIGVNGPLDLQGLLDAAWKENRELVVLWNQSPAFTDVNLMVHEMTKFAY